MTGASGSWISETISENPDIPSNVKIGDIIVSKFTYSRCAQYLKWEDWHHAGIVVSLSPLKIVEATGISIEHSDDKKAIITDKTEPVVEYEFLKQRKVKMLDGNERNGNLYLDPTLKELLWLSPNFPDPLREIDHWKVKDRNRKIIANDEARTRVVAFARAQIGEPYTYLTTKLSERLWYCSKLPYKAYSRTVTNMYLETFGAGPYVTPEDLVDSKRSTAYHHWLSSKYYSE
jgi:hypothetical protein